MTYEYVCELCGTKLITKSMNDTRREERCGCGLKMMRVYSCNLSGTRDGFGIGKEFVDDTSGAVIDTWKKWEKAGYRDAKEVVAPHIRNEVKRKENKIKNFDSGKKFSVGG